MSRKPSASCTKALHIEATISASKPEGLVIVEFSINELVCIRVASTRSIKARLALTHAETVALHKALSKEARRLPHVA
ncbi:hypothetical protein [Propionivibrio sp.]|uniref:hypothetical protein n=1 Tax=Propionivibrio sp. TaxID=2212460 RepID=UPI003BF047F8